MDIKLDVGIAIRLVRQSKGWSQEELAERAGLHRTYISGVERGVRNPTITVLKAVSDALDITLSNLLRDRT